MEKSSKLVPLEHLVQNVLLQYLQKEKKVMNNAKQVATAGNATCDSGHYHNTCCLSRQPVC